MIEIYRQLDVAEIKLIEPSVLQISGKFGDIDISADEVQIGKPKRLLTEGEKNEDG